MGWTNTQETPEQQKARQAESDRTKYNADKTFGQGTLQETSIAGDAEAGKRNYVTGVSNARGETLDYARTAAEGGNLVSPAQKVDLLNSLNAARRQQLAGAAADGVMHSGALGQARRATAQKQAMASAALLAEEERLQREQTAKIQQMNTVTNEAAKDVPTFIEQDGHNYPTFERERAIDVRRNNEINELVSTLQKKRLPPATLQAMFNKEIQNTYAQLIGDAVSEARRLGMDDQYVAGLEESMKQDMQRSMAGSAQMVSSLSGPDPQATATFLQSIYRQDTYEAAEQLRAGNPLISILAGGIGAMIGGAATGTPVGAKAGYTVGSAVGQFAQTLG